MNMDLNLALLSGVVQPTKPPIRSAFEQSNEPEKRQSVRTVVPFDVVPLSTDAISPPMEESPLKVVLMVG